MNFSVGILIRPCRYFEHFGRYFERHIQNTTRELYPPNQTKETQLKSVLFGKKVCTGLVFFYQCCSCYDLQYQTILQGHYSWSWMFPEESPTLFKLSPKQGNLSFLIWSYDMTTEQRKLSQSFLNIAWSNRLCCMEDSDIKT